MSVTCVECGHETERYTIKFVGGKTLQSCRVCTHPRHSGYASCVNPYSEMVLDHVTGEDGKPLRVTSKRQLLEAEKKYKFRSLVAHSWEENFDKPPQQEKAIPVDPRDRILKQLGEQTGRRDDSGNKLGFMHSDIAKEQLRDLKRKGISIDEW